MCFYQVFDFISFFWMRFLDNSFLHWLAAEYLIIAWGDGFLHPIIKPKGNSNCKIWGQVGEGFLWILALYSEKTQTTNQTKHNNNNKTQTNHKQTLQLLCFSQQVFSNKTNSNTLSNIYCNTNLLSKIGSMCVCLKCIYLKTNFKNSWQN